MKLLFVEDDRGLSAQLTRLLGQSGYVVEPAYTVEAASQLLLTQTYDAMVLDITSPGMQGHRLLKSLRSKNNDVPVLIISAHNSLHDVVECLNFGADDYLTKPFHTQELEARLRSLLRRSFGRVSPILSCGALHYDTNSKRFSSAGVDLSLTPREHAILRILIRVPGKTVSKKEMADGLCTLEDSVSRKALEIHLVRLRKKIENSGAQIVTLRGLGYTLTGDRRVINSGSEKFREVVMGCGTYT